MKRFFLISLTLISVNQYLLKAQGKWNNYNEQSGLVTDWNQTIFIDGDSIWFGGSFNNIGGAQLYYNGTWTTYNKDNSGLLNNSVWGYAKDKENNLWIASVGGVNKFDGTTWTSYSKTNAVRAVFVDFNDKIWICTYGGGVSSFDGISWTDYTTSEGLISNNVLNGFQHSDSTYWFVTTDGVNSYNGGIWTSYTMDDGLTDNFTRSIFEDFEGNIWVGSINGLNKFDGSNWTKVIEQSQIRISAIGQDQDSCIWIGSDNNQGIYKNVDNQWIHYTSPTSLLANYINDIKCDQYGNLWFSASGKGVTQLIPYEINRMEQINCGDSITLSFNCSKSANILWSNSEFLSDSSIMKPKAYPTDSMVFNVNFILGNDTILDSVAVNVRKLDPDFLYERQLCYGDTALLQFSGFAPSGSEYIWNIDNGNLINNNDSTELQIVWVNTGDKLISLQIKNNHCYSGLNEDTIFYNAIPISEFVIDTNKLCNADTVLITYTGTGSTGATYNWNFNTGNIISGTGQGEYQINWLSAGNKNISLSVEENGCTSGIFSKNITVYQPNSSFTLDNVVCENQNTNIVFKGNASDSAIFNWDFDGANIVSESNETYVVKWNSLGDKNVSLSINDNGCISSQTVETIEHNTIPTPTFSVPENVCYSSTANIQYIGTASNSASFDWNFDNASVLSGTGEGPYEIMWGNSGTKSISLNVSENGCSSDTIVYLNVEQQTQPIPICMVSVDSSNHNMIVWEQPIDNPYDSIIIYKETSQADIYEKIGSQSANESSVYIDKNSNSSQNSSRYKIAALDTCGYETSQSDYHKTIHLTINSGIGGAWNLIWNAYEGFNYSTYNIYRGTSDNSLLKIAEIPSNTFSYTDLTPPVGTIYYQIEVVNPNECNISNLKSTNSYYGSSRSNIVNSNQVNSITNLSLDGIEIYPNPANDKLYIEAKGISNYNFEILSLEGKLLIQNQNLIENTEIDISNLKSGMYFIRLSNNNNSMDVKFIKK